MEIQNDLQRLEAEIEIQKKQLIILLNDTVELQFQPPPLEERVIQRFGDQELLANNPVLAYVFQQIETSNAEREIESAKLLPDIMVGYFNQSLIGSETKGGDLATPSNRFTGIQAGISIPIFFGSYKGRVQAAKLKEQIARTNADYYNTALNGRFDQQSQEIAKYRESINYYKEKAVPQADLIIQNAQKSFENGAINYVEYFQNLNQALEIKYNYLNSINEYNLSIIDLEYLIGQ